MIVDLGTWLVMWRTTDVTVDARERYKVSSVASTRNNALRVSLAESALCDAASARFAAGIARPGARA